MEFRCCQVKADAMEVPMTSFASLALCFHLASMSPPAGATEQIQDRLTIEGGPRLLLRVGFGGHLQL